MIIAATTQDNEIFQHFGKCPTFTLFTVEEGRVCGKRVIDAEGSGHSALAGFLKQHDVDVVICGGIGQGARDMLADAGMQLVYGVQGNIDAAVARYIAGDLASDPAAQCDHHHEEGHSCDCANHCY